MLSSSIASVRPNAHLDRPGRPVPPQRPGRLPRTRGGELLRKQLHLAGTGAVGGTGTGPRWVDRKAGWKVGRLEAPPVSPFGAPSVRPPKEWALHGASGPEDRRDTRNARVRRHCQGVGVSNETLHKPKTGTRACLSSSTMSRSSQPGEITWPSCSSLPKRRLLVRPRLELDSLPFERPGEILPSMDSTS